ncbi:MAG: flagellar biosynthesis anti-sigma factor FlgM [Deltaproteobacteria bacterium]|nr:flagellar biosynthesis anti-sigma factor FlgM [Deltaproteobacteria bacterium]
MMNSIEGQPITTQDEERAQKVERLKRMIQTGSYQVDALALADRMLDVGIIEDDDGSFIH